MTNDTMLGTVYILMAAMLVVAAMLSRRGPVAQMLTTGVGLAAIFSAGFIIFSFRDDLGYLGQRLKAEATGEPVSVGETLRIPMAMDGHFWVHAKLNGRPVKFLVDTGATMTTIDRATAERLGITIDNRREQMVQTGNGMIKVGMGRADELAVDRISRSGVGLHITGQEDINVLGMNFLSTLNRWGVEGRWLVLEG